jgi:hypothetical protein
MAEYGFAAAFLNSVPEIKRLVKKATAGGWEMDKFLDALKVTKWWKSRSDAQRRFDVEFKENPGEVKDKLRKAYASVSLIAAKLGVKLTNTQIKNLGKSFVRNDLSDDALREAIGRIYSTARRQSGLSLVARADLQEMAGNYAVRVGWKALDTMVKGVVMGRRSAEDYEEYFRAQAERAYPSIKAQLNNGFTVRQILDPYIQLAADEVGINPATADLNNSMWTRPIQQVDKAGAAPRSMTFDEWTSHIRTDKRYGFDKSQRGQRAAAVLSNELMQAFGAKG